VSYGQWSLGSDGAATVSIKHGTNVNRYFV
jgi:hypothetical protein